MESIRSLAGTAAAAVLLALPLTTLPAAAATTDDCASAQAAADRARKDFDETKKAYEAQIAAGGHPGAAGRQELADADVRRSVTAAEAERVCDSSA
ncbi:hypothetical protein ABZ719_36625 [Streptomyces sp. NPDC006743]|uniref:hypothetical protein n=1 Tax=Streptomyces sp. NPDC006743 TaxID=3154480 RepID=UPI003454F9FF